MWILCFNRMCEKKKPTEPKKNRSLSPLKVFKQIKYRHDEKKKHIIAVVFLFFWPWKFQSLQNAMTTLWHKHDTDRNAYTARLASSQWFNDSSATGEWSHSNILFWPVLWVPLRGLADMILACTGATEAPASPSYWQDLGGCPTPDTTQQRTCGIKPDEAEELLIEVARERMSWPLPRLKTLSEEEGAR